MISIKNRIASYFGVTSALLAEGNVLLLTFDDGPDPHSTPAILDLLDQYNATAIFFIVAGRIPKAPQLLGEIIERGHQLGNHSYSHWLANPPGYSDYVADLQKCQHEIEKVCGVQPRVFRPPLGQITAGSLLAARKLKLHYLRWSLDSRDWELRDDDAARQQGADLARRACAGDIVLMHDDNAHTPVLLETLLPELSKKGISLRAQLPLR